MNEAGFNADVIEAALVIQIEMKYEKPTIAQHIYTQN